MRVLAGELKGQRLVTPRGPTTRPTSDQVRIACLDTLMPFLGAGPFLDVFAGAGGVGIEALSRGAPSRGVRRARRRTRSRALRDNVDAPGPRRTGRASCRGDAARARRAPWRAAGERFAVVFLDPPYDAPRAADALARGRGGRCSCPGARARGAARDEGAAAADARAARRVEGARGFGETTLTFLRAGA